MRITENCCYYRGSSKRFNINEDDIDNIEIDFITFDNLIKKYEIDSIDNLQIDVEGAEYKILKSIDFRNIRIDQIFFEKKHFDGYMEQGKKFDEIRIIDNHSSDAHEQFYYNRNKKVRNFKTKKRRRFKNKSCNQRSSKPRCIAKRHCHISNKKFD